VIYHANPRDLSRSFGVVYHAEGLNFVYFVFYSYKMGGCHLQHNQYVAQPLIYNNSSWFSNNGVDYTSRTQSFWYVTPWRRKGLCNLPPFSFFIPFVKGYLFKYKMHSEHLVQRSGSGLDCFIFNSLTYSFLTQMNHRCHEILDKLVYLVYDCQFYSNNF
jgi:hypothetical protein